jgi:hypothetical protein
MIDTSLIFDGTVSAGPISAIGSTTSQVTGVAITATRVSTNIIDWLTGRDVGSAVPLTMHVIVATSFTSSSATTLQVSYQVCATTNGTYKDLILSPIIPLAQLVPGTPLFRYDLPVNQVLNATAGVLATPGRYGQLNYTVATGPFSGGTVFAYITARDDRNQYWSYPSAYTVAVATGEI